MADINILMSNTALEEGILDDHIGDSIGDGVEIVVVDPGYIRVLNRRFRHMDRSTDVLSFDLSDPGSTAPEGTIYVDGRLYPPVEELLERIYHGYLHLCGRSHDDPEGSAEMEQDVKRMVLEALKRGGGTLC